MHFSFIRYQSPIIVVVLTLFAVAFLIDVHFEKYYQITFLVTGALLGFIGNLYLVYYKEYKDYVQNAINVLLIGNQQINEFRNI